MQIENIFSSVKALGAYFNFCTNRNASFGLNTGPDSSCKADLNVKLTCVLTFARHIKIKILEYQFGKLLEGPRRQSGEAV